MNWRHLIPVYLIFILVFGILWISCQKESKCDSLADTTIIAKIFHPERLVGKDAVIESIVPNSCFGDSSYLTIFSLTNGGQFNTARTLIEFKLSEIPPQTKVKTAILSLYWISYQNLTEHIGDNAFSVYRIVQEWDENTVTWNNQPLTSTLHPVSVSKSRYINQTYTNIDVTNLVQDIIDYPSASHGFMLKLDEETPFRLVILGSSDNLGSSTRPKLVVYL